MKSFLPKFFLIFLFFNQLNLIGQTTKAMTFNIRYDNPGDKENWWENRKSEVAGLINYYHPDFLGIQEGLHHQVQFILENTKGYKYIGSGRDDGETKGEYSAIFYDTSKYELIAQKTFWLSEKPDAVSVGWDAAMERVCTYGLFKNKKDNRVIDIFNTHFDHIGIEAQKKSAELIVAKINEYGLDQRRVIVMGDLNSEPLSEPIKILENKLDLIPVEKIYGPIGTFNNFDNTMVLENRIDYIFTKNMEVINYRHIDDRRKNNLCVSDHLPVLIEIKN